VLVAGALAVAVAVNAFELVNRYLGDPFRGGWRAGEQDRWTNQWSNDALYSLVDRNAILGRALEPLSPLFDASLGRYVGIVVLALVVAGALTPELLGSRRARFWTVLALLPLSVWLSFGATPVIGPVIERWRFLLGEPAIPWFGRAAAVLGAAAFLAAGAAATVRNLPALRSRPIAGVALFLIALAVFLCAAPLPFLRKTVLFLRDLRNPDWFVVTAIPIATVFPAALCVASLQARWGARRFWTPVFGAILLAVVVDFLPYRVYLEAYQKTEDEVTDLRRAGERIAVDPEDFRVLPAERYSNQADLLFLWHGKRLAWDFRSYTAPRRTQELLDSVFERIGAGATGSEAAVLAGLANVKYVADDPTRGPDPSACPGFRLVKRGDEVRVYENLAYRPFVQAYAEARVLVGGEGEPGIALTAALAERGIGLARLETVDASRVPAGHGVVADLQSIAAGIAPDGAVPLAEAMSSLPDAARFASPPEVRWSRPSPESIRVESRAAGETFLVVSESFHPWWTATLDGRPVDVLAGQYAFLGAFVPPGEHVLEFRFRRPWTFAFWGGVGLVSFLACVAALLVRGPSGDRP
jgi:hypothetical protein